MNYRRNHHVCYCNIPEDHQPTQPANQLVKRAHHSNAVATSCKPEVDPSASNYTDHSPNQKDSQDEIKEEEHLQGPGQGWHWQCYFRYHSIIDYTTNTSCEYLSLGDCEEYWPAEAEEPHSTNTLPNNLPTSGTRSVMSLRGAKGQQFTRQQLFSTTKSC